MPAFQDFPPIVRNLWRTIRSTVTPLGWVLLSIAAVGLGLGIGLGWLEFLAAGVMAGILVLLALPFLWGSASFDLDFDLVDSRVVAGSPGTGKLTVRAGKRSGIAPTRLYIPVGELFIRLSLPRVRAGHEHSSSVIIPTEHRGILRVGPVRSVRKDPLGLFTREHDWANEQLLYVHPTTLASSDIHSGHLRDLEGKPSSVLTPTDLSFHTLREYQPGDSPRHIHWKSTAKTQNLMVRQFEETRRSRLAIVLAGSLADFADGQEYELAVSAAASLGVRAISQGRDIAFITAGPAVGAVSGAHGVGGVRGAVGIVAGGGPDHKSGLPFAVKLPTISTGALLDTLAAVGMAQKSADLVGLAAHTAQAHSDVSLAVLVGGSTISARSIRRGLLAFPSSVSTLVLQCQPGAQPRVRELGEATVLTLGMLADLGSLLRRGVRT